MDETQVSTWHKPRRPIEEQVRNAMVWIAILALAVGTVMLLVALNQVVVVWFKHQYVPFARAFMALAIMAGAIAVIWRLTASRE